MIANRRLHSNFSLQRALEGAERLDRPLVILEWSPTPRAALDVMIELMNKCSLDGRDPNSYTGYFCWTLGGYDRPWAPERPIFGQIRDMRSANTARKLRVKAYIEKYSR